MCRLARLSRVAALVLVAAIGGAGCGGDSEKSHKSSRAAGSGRGNHAGPLPLEAVRETTPVPDGGDAADDPAIWVNPARPANSAIVGTNKKGGLAVYDLAGRQIHYRADGEMNNVDLREGFPLAGRRTVLVAAGNRSDNTMRSIASMKARASSTRSRRAASTPASRPTVPASTGAREADGPTTS